MILVKPSFKIMQIMAAEHVGEEALVLIENIGRTCYKSENRIDSDSHLKFVDMILRRGHESVIEHSAMTVKFIIDRGVSHELVRHRLCAFSQESTRYCNYKGGVTFVIPPWLSLLEGEYTKDTYIEGNEKVISIDVLMWLRSIFESEDSYLRLIHLGWSPQQARSVLPNSLKTEIVVTTNFREWRHIFKLRCSSAAHPQMQEIMKPLLEKCKETIPVIFDEI